MRAISEEAIVPDSRNGGRRRALNTERIGQDSHQCPPPPGSALPGSARWCLPWGQYLLSLSMTKLDTTVHKGPNLAQKEFSQPGRRWVLPLPALCQPLVYPGPGSQLRSEFLAASTVVGILLDLTMPLPSSSRGLRHLGFMEAGVEGSRALCRAHQTGFPPSLLSLFRELEIFLSPFTSVWASLLAPCPKFMSAVLFGLLLSLGDL